MTRFPRLAFAVLFALAAAVSAGIPAAQGNVSDFAKLLDANTKSKIEASIDRLSRTHDVKLAVAVIKRAAPEANLKAWAVSAFNDWGVGDAGKDNGLLVVLATVDRRVEIEVGYGLEGRLTDSRAGRLLDTHAVPHFRANQWAQGLASLVSGIERHFDGLASRAAAPPIRSPPYRSSSTAPRRRSSSSSSGNGFLGGILFFLVAIFGFASAGKNGGLVLSGVWLIWSLSFPVCHRFVDRHFYLAGAIVTIIIAGTFSTGVGSSPDTNIFTGLMLLMGWFAGLYTLDRRCPRCEIGYINVSSQTLRSATYSSSGRGQTTSTCPKCSYHDVSTYTIPRRTRSTSSSSSSSSSWSSSSSSYSSSSYSSSSYGGGSSGGGGAGRSF